MARGMQLRKTLIPVFGISLFAIGPIGYGLHATMKGLPEPESVLLPAGASALLIGCFFIRARDRMAQLRILRMLAVAASNAVVFAAIADAVALSLPIDSMAPARSCGVSA